MNKKKNTVEIDANELEQLKQKLALHEAKDVQMPNSSLSQEMAKIRNKGPVNTLAIPVRDIDDHKNIFLYTPLNKRIGPLHPNNAETTMMRFHDHGIQLYVEPRTSEQVEAYKQTDYYKKKHIAHLKERELRHKKQKMNSFETVSEAIAKELGVAVKTLTKMPKKEDKPVNV